MAKKKREAKRGRRRPRKDSPAPKPASSEMSWFMGLEQPVPTQRKPMNPALMSSGIVQPILPPRATEVRADLEGKGGVQADAMMFSPARHAEMLSWTAAIRSLMARLPAKSPPGIGHNQPPITGDDIVVIGKALATLELQPVMPKSPDDARTAQSVLTKIRERLGTYLDTFLLEASKSGGKEFGKQLARAPYWLALWYALMKLGQSITAWLN
jgi:hypothetical protein